jgi:hypothetical protein
MLVLFRDATMHHQWAKEFPHGVIHSSKQQLCHISLQATVTKIFSDNLPELLAVREADGVLTHFSHVVQHLS